MSGDADLPLPFKGGHRGVGVGWVMRIIRALAVAVSTATTHLNPSLEREGLCA
jgi:hypothetical protein